MSKNNQESNVYLSREGYNIWAKNYNKSIPLLNAFEKGILIGKMPDIRGKKILDLGAGTGRVTEHLLMNGADVTAIDISEEMLNILKKDYPQANIIVADVNNIPCKDDEFDFVVAGFLVVHLKTLEKCFREVYRVLKPGGEFFLTNINQKKAPKLKLNSKEEIVIKSFYHRPQDVIVSLEESFFEVVDEEFVEEQGIWVNQIIRCRK